MKALLLALLISTSAATLNKDQLAEVTFHDQDDKLHTLHLQYFVDNERLQYGVKFAMGMHPIKVDGCQADLSSITEEYFAAYLVVPENCNALDLIKDCETRGANFIFLDGQKASNSHSKLYSDSYQIPVFQVDDSEDLFMMKSSSLKQVYLSIFFMMVI